MGVEDEGKKKRCSCIATAPLPLHHTLARVPTCGGSFATVRSISQRRRHRTSKSRSARALSSINHHQTANTPRHRRLGAYILKCDELNVGSPPTPDHGPPDHRPSRACTPWAQPSNLNLPCHLPPENPNHPFTLSTLLVSLGPSIEFVFPSNTPHP